VPARWTYGAEGAAYPVRPGQTWECGRHVFTCSSLFRVPGLGAATVIYADPPWNQGNLASFRTKAGLKSDSHDWLDVYRRIAEIAGQRPVFLEGGCRQAAAVQAVLSGPQVRQWPISYYRYHPAVLHYAGPDLNGLDPSGLDDDDVPGYILTRLPAGIVGDPCAGRGVTSRAAEAAGWSSVNVELHPNRVSAALARMTKMTGHPVVLLS
jgi:hypothetical protein